MRLECDNCGPVDSVMPPQLDDFNPARLTIEVSYSRCGECDRVLPPQMLAEDAIAEAVAAARATILNQQPPSPEDLQLEA